MKAVEVLISGRVQGVGFRAFVERTARRLDVAGWVRNRADGRVEAHLEGGDAAVEEAVQACREGPGAGRVDELRVAEVEPVGHAGFEVRATT